jgi:hypothetical protein
MPSKCGVAVVALGLLSLTGCANEDEEARPAVPVATSVTYETNIYACRGATAGPVAVRSDVAGGPAEQPAPTVVYVDRAGPAAEPPPPDDAPSTGLATCDAYIEAAHRCARAIASDPAALARFDREADAARAEARAVTSTQDPLARSEMSSRCEAALRAYDEAPCVLP